MNSIRQQAGMSLLETLVAIVVFSVGMTGVASLMLTSMRNNDATLLRTQSTILANEIYEKMLANLPAAAAGSYNLPMSSDLPLTTDLDCDPKADFPGSGPPDEGGCGVGGPAGAALWLVVLLLLLATVSGRRRGWRDKSRPGKS